MKTRIYILTIICLVPIILGAQGTFYEKLEETDYSKIYKISTFKTEYIKSDTIIPDTIFPNNLILIKEEFYNEKGEIQKKNQFRDGELAYSYNYLYNDKGRLTGEFSSNPELSFIDTTHIDYKESMTIYTSITDTSTSYFYRYLNDKGLTKKIISCNSEGDTISRSYKTYDEEGNILTDKYYYYDDLVINKTKRYDSKNRILDEVDLDTENQIKSRSIYDYKSEDHYKLNKKDENGNLTFLKEELRINNKYGDAIKIYTRKNINKKSLISIEYYKIEYR